jgi:hypothetical protein
VVPFFKVTEAFQLEGSTSMARRDMRSGSQQATANVGPDGSLRVAISWGEPNVGGVTEVYSLGEEAGTLECLSTVAVAAGSVTTRSVFRRSDRWKPRFSWNPLMGIRG